MAAASLVEFCNTVSPPNCTQLARKSIVHGSVRLWPLLNRCSRCTVPQIDDCYSVQLLREQQQLTKFQIAGGKGLGDALLNTYVSTFRDSLEHGEALALVDGPVISAMCQAFDCGFPVFSGDCVKLLVRRDSAVMPCRLELPCNFSWSHLGSDAWSHAWRTRNRKSCHTDQFLPSFAIRSLFPRLSEHAMSVMAPALLDRAFEGSPDIKSALLRVARSHGPLEEKLNMTVLHFRLYPPHVEKDAKLTDEDDRVKEFVAAVGGKVLAALSRMIEPLDGPQLPVDLFLSASNKSIAYSGPPVFCASDSVEACQWLRNALSPRTTVNFFNLKPVHVKHISNTAKLPARAQPEHLERDSLEVFSTFFTFFVMSRAEQLYSTGSDFASAALLYGRADGNWKYSAEGPVP